MKRPLTFSQAESEARWRWGGMFERAFARYKSTERKPFQVGTKLFGKIKVRGQGTSWEGAFGNADRETNLHRAQK